MTSQELAQQVANLQAALRSLTAEADRLAIETAHLATGAADAAPAAGHSFFIIVGALIATGSTAGFTFSTALGFLAVILASVNIFGGFIVTQRMLAMYKKKQKK